MSVRVLIAEKDKSLRGQMRDLVCAGTGCEVVGLARDGEEAVQMAMQFLPHVALISYDLPGMSGVQACEIMTALAPDIMPVVVSDAKTPDRIEAAMKSGARALVARPLQARDLADLIADLAEISKRRESPEIQEWKDPARFPKIVCVTGAKGGVGKTTIAVNLAVMLAKHLPNKVAVIDLYTQFGDIAMMFNVAPKHTLAELSPVWKDLDQDLVRNYVTGHSSGVHVLVASVDPQPLDAVSIECLDGLLYVLKRLYRYVIVDVPPILHPMTLHVLAHSNTILLVANLFDLTTATDTKKFYDALAGEHIPRENVRVVLNRVSKVNRLHTADVEQMFDCGILAHIPNDRRLVSAVNQGLPLAVNDGDSPYGRSIVRLAAAVSDLAGAAPAPEKIPERRRAFRAK